MIIASPWGKQISFHAPLSVSTGAGGERYVAFVNRAQVRRLGHVSPVWELRAQSREWLHRSVSRVGYPASALLEALLIGSREDVPEDLYDGFLKTGSLHILALSGLHVTVIYGIVIGLLAFLRPRWLRFLLATLVLLLYQVLAGFMPSLLRATVMIVIGGIAVMLDRDSEPVNLLAISCIVILLIDPFQVSSLSFQLSFLALVGILGIGPLVQRGLEGFLPRFLLVPLAMSIGAQVATLPLIILQFGAYYPSGIAAGLLLVPLTTGLLWAGLAWLPLSVIPWPFLHDLCAQLFSLLYRIIEGCASAFARYPGDHLRRAGQDACRGLRGGAARGPLRDASRAPRASAPACKCAWCDHTRGRSRAEADMNPDSPVEIRMLLEERGLSLKKRWGQNFLVNRGARERLVSLLAPEPKRRFGRSGRGSGR